MARFIIVCVLVLIVSCGRSLPPVRVPGHAAVSFSVGGHNAFIFRSSNSRGAWVWYAPTLIGNYPNHAIASMFKDLLDQGLSVAGVDIGESFGNTPGQIVYSRFFQTVQSVYALNHNPCFLVQSRGALMAFNWTSNHADSVSCIVAIYPVMDMRSYPGLDSAKLQSAYGLDAAGLAQHLSENNPISRLIPLAQHGVKLLFLHGDRDALVPLAVNSLAASREYEKDGGSAKLISISERGHEETEEFFRSKAIISFLVNNLTAR